MAHLNLIRGSNFVQHVRNTKICLLKEIVVDYAYLPELLEPVPQIFALWLYRINLVLYPGLCQDTSVKSDEETFQILKWDYLHRVHILLGTEHEEEL